MATDINLILYEISQDLHSLFQSFRDRSRTNYAPFLNFGAPAMSYDWGGGPGDMTNVASITFQNRAPCKKAIHRCVSRSQTRQDLTADLVHWFRHLLPWRGWVGITSDWRCHSRLAAPVLRRFWSKLKPKMLESKRLRSLCHFCMDVPSPETNDWIMQWLCHVSLSRSLSLFLQLR